MAADLKTSQEAASGPVADANIFRGVQSGSNVQFSFTKVKTWIKGWVGFSDLAGSVAAGQMPALTGDVTTSAGAVATSLTSHAVINAKLAQMAAATLKGNATASLADAADFTIQGLSTLASPHATLDYLLIYDHVTGTLKSATTGAVAGANTAGVSSINGAAGTLTLSGASVSGSTLYAPRSGFANRLRNSSLTSWFHGSGALTVTTAGGWGAEGIYIIPTGASVTAQQIANAITNPLSYYAQKITGAASVTDVSVRFVVESYDAAPLAGLQVTFQVPILNSTGASITPTITVKQANAQDSSYGALVSAVNMQTVADGASATLAYSFAVGALGYLGLSIDIDFGNNFSTTGKSIQIGGGFDLRATPGQATGTVSAPPTPEIPTEAADIAWNQRFYETSYDNGTAAGTSTANGMINLGWTAGTGTAEGGGFGFRTSKRATPSMSYWDRVGSSGLVSWYTSGAWSDGHGALAGVGVGQSNVVLSVTVSAAHNLFVHYAADATLTGA